MKRLTVLILLTLIPFVNLIAQEEEEEISTILGSVQTWGAYGGLNMGYTQIDNKHAMTLGAQGAVILNHNIAFGFIGRGFFNEYHYDANLDENVNLQGGYGGLLIEPIIGSSDAIHFSFPITIGAGGIVHAEKYYDYDHDYYEYHNRDFVNDTEVFFVLEPGAEIEINMFKFWRLSLGAFYRYTSDIDLYDTPKHALNGFTYMMTFKFGKF